MREWLKPDRVLPVGGVALIWVALFKLNAYWFEFLAVSPYVGWIFLPAALRVLAVLLFKGRGVLGLFLGALMTNASLWGTEWWDAFSLSAVSALAPALAIGLGFRWLKLEPTLNGLNGWQLLTLSALAALTNSVLHGLLFYALDYDTPWQSAMLSMTVGDFAGTLLVLYSAYFAMRWWRPKN
jgi:hypothetical protein